MRKANNSLEKMFYFLLATFSIFLLCWEIFSENLTIGGERWRALVHLLTSQPRVSLSVLKSFLKSTELYKGKVRGRAGAAGGDKGLSLVFPNPSAPKA